MLNWSEIHPMRLLYIFFLLFVMGTGKAQEEDAWIFLNDKPSKSEFLQNPELMLSQRALQRRTAQGIDIDELDVPVEREYLTLLSQVNGLQILSKSKWLNAIHVMAEPSVLESVESLTFVDHVEYANKSRNQSGRSFGKMKKSLVDKLAIEYDYGNTDNQIKMLNGQVLHEMGYTGRGIQIAVMDSGFPNVDNIAGFDKLIAEGRLLGGYNFVHRSDDFLVGHPHGTAVLSTMAGMIEGQYVGSAPDASYYLFITEDGSKETPLEESLWAEAAERADSLGVDMITTSLGYTQFDNSSYDYSYDDLDGKTTFISRAAEVAVSRGLLVVNSAGNEGNKPWRYVSAPADANGVLGIGAVNADGLIAGFSSFGPTVDQRIKPDLLAQGVSAAVIRSDGQLMLGNGTSFAAPIMTGVLACMLEAFPDVGIETIKDQVIASSHLYLRPTDQEGFGIPDFMQAYLNLIALQNQFPDDEVVIYPNPVQEVVFINLPVGETRAELFVFDSLGKRVIQEEIKMNQPELNIAHLIPGIYVGRIDTASQNLYFKLIKN